MAVDAKFNLANFIESKESNESRVGFIQVKTQRVSAILFLLNPEAGFAAYGVSRVRKRTINIIYDITTQQQVEKAQRSYKKNERFGEINLTACVSASRNLHLSTLTCDPLLGLLGIGSWTL